MSRSPRWAVLSLLLLLPLLTPAGPSPEKPRRLAIVGGLLIDGNGGSPVKDSTILLEGSRIAAVGPRGRVAIPPGTEIIDASRKSVLPGLINSNCELALNPLSATQTGSVGTAFNTDDNIQRSLQTLLRQGITAVRDTSGSTERLAAFRTSIGRGELAGPRLFLSSANITGQADFDARKKKLRPRSASELRKRFHPVTRVPDDLDTLRNAQPDFWFIFLTGDNWGSHNLMSDELLRAIVEEGHREGKVVDARVHSIMGIRSGLDAGLDVMEHPNLSDPLPPGLAEEYAARGVFLVPLHTAIEGYVEILENPAVLNDPIYRGVLSLQEYELLKEVQGRLALARERPDRRPSNILSPIGSVMSLDEWRTALQFTGENLRKFIRARAPIAMGTGCSGTPFNFVDVAWHVRELRTYVRFGMTPMEALQTATKNAAELLGREDELGTLEPGKLADLIVVDGNPLIDTDALLHVEVVIKNGERYK